jgi:hypothetical protein
MTKFYEICGCKLIPAQGHESNPYPESVEQVPDKEAEFFGVYETEEGGFMKWLADFKTKQDAQEYLEKII